MRIVLDNIIFSMQKTGGISIVWYELIKKILSIKSDVAFLEYKRSKENIFRNKLQLLKNEVSLSGHLPLKIERYRNPYINSIENDYFIFHSSYYRTCRNKKAINITTVHDFTYEYYSRGFKKFVHCWQKHRAIRNSDYIICISNNTKSDLLKFLPDVDANKIHVIYNGVSNEYLPISSNDFKNPLNPYTPYSFVLFVGSREKYKNFRLAAKAVAESKKNMLIVGNPLNKEEVLFLNSIFDKSSYCFRKRVSNVELNNIYNQAYCLLYPSSYEGFGIPVIEAQKAGCPVIAYNVSSIPEIIGDTSLLLNKLTIEAIVEKFKLIGDRDIRSKIIHNGFENAKRFSWDIMGEKVLELYNKAIKDINVE